MAYDKFAAVDSSTLLFPPTVRANLAGVSPNYVINGNFDIWQRGTSFSSSGYTADRWYFSYGGTVTVSRESSIVPTNSMYSAKVTTGASSSSGELYQAFELSDIEMMQGKTVTFSTLVRAQTSFSGTAVIAVQTNATANTQTGGTWSEVASATITPSTSTFNRVTVSYTVPANTNGLRVRMAMSSAQASGTGLYWAQVQLEAGAVATPFRRNANSIQGELAACQRYYQRLVTDIAYGTLGMGSSPTTTTYTIIVPFRTTMRVVPTSTENSALSTLWITTGAANYTINTMTFQAAESSTNFGNLSGSCATIPQYAPNRLIGQNNATAYIAFSAEL